MINRDFSLSPVLSGEGRSALQHRDGLLECIQALEALTAATEDEFLHIGSRLRDFYGGAAKIAGLASTVAGLMSGDNITKAIEGLNVLVERMAAYLRRSETVTSNGVEKLTTVSETINEVHLHLSELYGIAKTIRMLAISNTIASVSMKRADEGSRALSDDIKNLSALIIDKSSAISGSTRSLPAYLEETLLKLNSLRASCRAKGVAVMKETASGVRSLTDRYSVSAETAEDISRTSSEISAGIGRVVASIQFHDIARQRFDNAMTAFAGMSEMLSGTAGQGDLPAEGGSGSDDISYEILDFCARQTASLRLTRDEFVSAVEDVIENLRSISSEVNGMLKKTGRIVGHDSSQGGSFLSGIEQGLAPVTSTLATLSENALVTEELSRTVGHAGKAIGEMSGFAKEIEEIGDDIGLIAFNAQVRAGAIGGEGRALDVIAEAIQRVSGETRTCITGISGLLMSMETHMADLSGGHGAAGTEGDEAAVMSEDLQRLVRSVQQVNGQIISTYDAVEESGRSVLREIGEVIDRINVHSLVEGTINGMLSTLEEIAVTVRGTSHGHDAGQRERGAFHSPGGGARVGGEKVPPAPVRKAAAGGSGEFGENVEFF